MTLKNLRVKEKCDPQNLKKYFISHFNELAMTLGPMELENIPDYIKQLQEIEVEGLNASPPDLEELKLTISRGKSFKSCRTKKESELDLEFYEN